MKKSFMTSGNRTLKVDISRILLRERDILCAHKVEFGCGVNQIVGRNGSGKSTFLRAISGVYEYKGAIVFEDFSLREDPLSYKRLLGYCPDSYSFIESITPRDLFILMSRCFQENVLDASFYEQCDELGFGSRQLNSKIVDLSYGNKRKMLIMASLISNPALWVLDEPFNGLDKVGVEWLKNKIISRKSETNIIIISHENNWLEDIGSIKYEI